MATKKLVPRGNDEGGIGTAAKTWGASWLQNLTITNLQTTTSTSVLVETSGNVEKRSAGGLCTTVADTENASCFVGLWEAGTGCLMPFTDEALLYDAQNDILNLVGTLKMGSDANTNDHVIQRHTVQGGNPGGSLSIFGGDTTGGTNTLGGHLNLYPGRGTGSASGTGTGVLILASLPTGSGEDQQSYVKNTLFYNSTTASGQRIYNPTDSHDYLDLLVGSNGSTRFATLDSAGSGAFLSFDIDGDITHDSATQKHYWHQNGTQMALLDTSGLLLDTISTDASLTSFLVETGGLIKKRPLSGIPSALVTVADTEVTTCFVGLYEAATGNLYPKTDEGLTYNAETGSELLTIHGNTVWGTVNTSTLNRLDRNTTNTGTIGGALSLGAGSITAQTNKPGGALYLTPGAGTGAASAGGGDSYIIASLYKDVASGTSAQTSYFAMALTADSKTNLELYSQDGGGDALKINVGAAGATTITTVDGGGAAAHIVLDADGDTSFKKTGTTLATVESLRTEHMLIACSDETTSLTVGTAKTTFRMPYAFTLTDVRASVGVNPTGAVLTIDINDDGTSIFENGTNNGVRLTVAASAKTSVGGTAHAFAQGGAAATPTVAIADDSEMTIDVDVIGSTLAGAGLKVTLIGHKTV